MSSFSPRLLLSILPFAVPLVSQHAAADPEMLWRTESATANGTGCRAGRGVPNADALFLSNGSDLSVVFSKLGFEFSAGAPGPLQASKNCAISVPFDLAAGRSPTSITQVVTFGIVKSANAQARLDFQGNIFGTNATPVALSFARGQEYMEPLATESRLNHFNVSIPTIRNHCLRQVPTAMLYSAKFAVSGSRNSINEDLILFSDSLDLRLEVRSDLSACPPIDVPTHVVKSVAIADQCPFGFETHPIAEGGGFAGNFCVRYATFNEGGRQAVADVTLVRQGTPCPASMFMVGSTRFQQSLCVRYSTNEALKKAFAAQTCFTSTERGQFTGPNMGARWNKLCVQR